MPRQMLLNPYKYQCLRKSYWVSCIMFLRASVNVTYTVNYHSRSIWDRVLCVCVCLCLCVSLTNILVEPWSIALLTLLACGDGHLVGFVNGFKGRFLKELNCSKQMLTRTPKIRVQSRLGLRLSIVGNFFLFRLQQCWAIVTCNSIHRLLQTSTTRVLQAAVRPPCCKVSPLTCDRLY